MRFDLKAPCKNCPFRTDATAIRFATRSRAEEIEESAYRYGFPCHLSAVHLEDEDSDDGESGGFVFGEGTQHCAGALIMYAKNGVGGNVPFEHLSNREQDRVLDRIDCEAPVYDGPDAFLDSYGPAERDDEDEDE